MVIQRRSISRKLIRYLDAVVRVLEVLGAVECRKEIKTLHQASTKSLPRIAEHREQRFFASAEASL